MRSALMPEPCRPVTAVHAGEPPSHGKTVMRAGLVPVVRATQTEPCPVSAAAGGKTVQGAHTASSHVPVRESGVRRAQPTPVVPLPTWMSGLPSGVSGTPRTTATTVMASAESYPTSMVLPKRMVGAAPVPVRRLPSSSTWPSPCSNRHAEASVPSKASATCGGDAVSAEKARLPQATQGPEAGAASGPPGSTQTSRRRCS